MGVNSNSNLQGIESKKKQNNTNDAPKVTINTIQRTALVERLPIDRYAYKGFRSVKYYDLDNLYPNKVKAIAERSGSTESAIKTLTKFTVGLGFEDDVNDIIINSDDQTMHDVLFEAGHDKSLFSGIALHMNYNIFGEVIEINEIQFELLRWSKDGTKLVWHQDWTKFRKEESIEYFPFNPDNVVNEINEVGGIENYNGQVFYWIPRKKDLYPRCRFDAVLDDSQFEAESKIFKISNIQNGFSADSIITLPFNIESTEENEEAKKMIKNLSGSSNAGRTILLTKAPGIVDNNSQRKIIEKIPTSDTDKKFLEQNEESKNNIYEYFQQPKILNGITQGGTFTLDDYRNAFHYYNSQTKSDRDQLEKVFNRIIERSIWADVGYQKIMPLEFVEVENNESNDNNNNANNLEQ